MKSVVVTSGIGGKPADGESFPKFTAHLLGRLRVSDEGLWWTPLMPWRHPRVVRVDWSAVRRIRVVAGTFLFDAEGWDRLVFGPSKQRLIYPFLEGAGFIVHRSPAHPDRLRVLRPGEQPDWNS